MIMLVDGYGRPYKNLDYHFGIIIDQNGKPVNHRSILKVFLNPILRKLFNKEIATEVLINGDNGKLYIENPVCCLVLRDATINSSWSLKYNLKPGYSVIKKRVLF